MKIRIVFILLLTLLLAILVDYRQERLFKFTAHYSDAVKHFLTDTKQRFYETIETHFKQTEAIRKLQKENLKLRIKLNEQMHFLRQLHEVYTALPQLKKIPTRNIALTQTISYVALGDFSQVILTRPRNIVSRKFYGMIQDGVAAGIAEFRDGRLYGYLNDNSKSRFSVYIGKHKAPGVAIGVEPRKMIVKFIPKWYEIKRGDMVFTAGLDRIFYAGIPVGKVRSVETESAYKVANIETFDDPYHPNEYFLITDANVSLLDMYDPSMSRIYERISPLMNLDPKIANIDKAKLKSCLDALDEYEAKSISSIPKRIDQTRADTVQPEAPLEEITTEHKKKSKRHKKHLHKKHSHRKTIRKKHKTKPSTLDLF